VELDGVRNRRIGNERRIDGGGGDREGLRFHWTRGDAASGDRLSRRVSKRDAGLAMRRVWCIITATPGPVKVGTMIHAAIIVSPFLDGDGDHCVPTVRWRPACRTVTVGIGMCT